MKRLLVLLLLVSACKTPSVEEINPIETYLQPVEKSEGEIRDEYMGLVNDYRHLKGINAFIYSPEIESLAQEHAQNMADATAPFGHTDSARRCEMLRTDLGPADLCSEIVAQGQGTPLEVFGAWTRSSVLESKILNARYTHTGLGLAKSSSGVRYWVQLFLEVL